jgi:hypothetical protein
MPLPPRYNFFLSLSPDEQKRLEDEAAVELRTPGNYVTRLVVAELSRKRPLKVSATVAERSQYNVKLRLTSQQRRELERRAGAEGRLVANYVSAVVVSRLGKG